MDHQELKALDSTYVMPTYARFDVDIDHGREDRSRNPSVVLSIRLHHRQSHTSVLAAISELESVRVIDEI